MTVHGRQWLVVGIIVLVQILVLSTAAMADSSVSIQISHSHYHVIKKRALAKGYDISTLVGRKGYKSYLNKNRVQKAAELGFDINTPAGRKAYQRYRQILFK